MTIAEKEPVLVVLQLSGGNDYLNTVVPYTDPHVLGQRPVVKVPEEQVLPLDDEVGLHPNMSPIKDIYDRGDVAILHGVGYQNSPRSHFRSMDIWHTCEPDTLGTRGGWGALSASWTEQRERRDCREHGAVAIQGAGPAGRAGCMRRRSGTTTVC